MKGFLRFLYIFLRPGCSVVTIMSRQLPRCISNFPSLPSFWALRHLFRKYTVAFSHLCILSTCVVYYGLRTFVCLYKRNKAIACMRACVFFISDCIGVVMLLLIHCFTLAFCALLASVSHSCTINTCSSGMSLALTPPHLGTWPHQVPFAF